MVRSLLSSSREGRRLTEPSIPHTRAQVRSVSTHRTVLRGACTPFPMERDSSRVDSADSTTPARGGARVRPAPTHGRLPGRHRASRDVTVTSRLAPRRAPSASRRGLRPTRAVQMASAAADGARRAARRAQPPSTPGKTAAARMTVRRQAAPTHGCELAGYSSGYESRRGAPFSACSCARFSASSSQPRSSSSAIMLSRSKTFVSVLIDVRNRRSNVGPNVRPGVSPTMTASTTAGTGLRWGCDSADSPPRLPEAGYDRRGQVLRPWFGDVPRPQVRDVGEADTGIRIGEPDRSS